MRLCLPNASPRMGTMSRARSGIDGPSRWDEASCPLQILPPPPAELPPPTRHPPRPESTLPPRRPCPPRTFSHSQVSHASVYVPSARILPTRLTSPDTHHAAHARKTKPGEQLRCPRREARAPATTMPPRCERRASARQPPSSKQDRIPRRALAPGRVRVGNGAYIHHQLPRRW